MIGLGVKGYYNCNPRPPFEFFDSLVYYYTSRLVLIFWFFYTLDLDNINPHLEKDAESTVDIDVECVCVYIEKL